MTPPRVRAAAPADARAIAGVQVASWRDSYAGIVPQAFLDGMLEEEWEERRRGNIGVPGTTSLVAEVDGAIVGFVFGGPGRETLAAYDAEVYALYVLRDRRRRGVGLRLLGHFANAAAAAGARTCALWVLRDNLPGRAFYESLGGRVVAEKDIPLGGQPLPEVAYGWSDIRRLGPSTRTM